MTNTRSGANRGFTVIEFAIAMAIVAVISALAMPSFNRMSENRRLKDAAISLSGAMNLARSEAIRTGNTHLVFFQTDAEGNDLKDADDNVVPILILEDATTQNCKIDGGEPFQVLRLPDDVAAGIATGTTQAPADQGNGSIDSGSSFTEPGGGAATWVLFRPDGTPLSFDSSCAIGGIGTGAGGFYFTNGKRTASVVLSPLGAPRVHSWSQGWDT